MIEQLSWCGRQHAAPMRHDPEISWTRQRLVFP
jgi:hypothetical protein